MAMTEITPVEIGRTDGASISFTALGADGIKFKNTGKEFVALRNDQAATPTVTIKTNFSKDSLDLPDLTIEMAAGDANLQEEIYGPFPTLYYNQTGGYVEVTSTDANTDIAVFSMTATT